MQCQKSINKVEDERGSEGVFLGAIKHIETPPTKKGQHLQQLCQRHQPPLSITTNIEHPKHSTNPTLIAAPPTPSPPADAPEVSKSSHPTIAADPFGYGYWCPRASCRTD
jgi:hypothetical protein